MALIFDFAKIRNVKDETGMKLIIIPFMKGRIIE